MTAGSMTAGRGCARLVKRVVFGFIVLALCGLGLIFGQQLFTNGALLVNNLVNNPTPTSTPTSTLTPTSTSTVTPSATPTSTPTSTSTVTPSATPTLLLTLTATEMVTRDNCNNTEWFNNLVNPLVETNNIGFFIDVGFFGEPCAATWRGAGTIYVSAVCPQGWVCTFSTEAGTQVYLGTGQVVGVNGATWRPLADFCTVLNDEKNYGKEQKPPFSVSPALGSHSCDPASG